MLHVSFSSLRVRLILLVLLAIIPASSLVLFTGVEQRRTAATVAQQEALQLALLTSAEQNQFIESTRQLLAGLARLPEVNNDDPAACSALFADILKQYPLYTNLGVTQPNGDLWCSAISPSNPTNLVDRAWFQDVVRTREFTIGGYVVGRITGKPVATFAYPILNETNQIQAVVFAALDLAWLNEFVARMALPSGSVLTVMDANGTILARNLEPEKWVGRTATEAPVAQTILALQSQGTLESVGLDGVNRLYAFAPFGSATQGGYMYVFVGIPTAVAYAPADQALTRNLIALGLVTVLALVAAWGIGDLTIVRHVNTLIATTQRIAAGDWDARTGLTRGAGEINQLARAFDQMAGSLQVREAARKRAEDALLRERDFAQQVMNTLGQGVTVTDSEGRFIYVNPAYARMVKVVPEELIGKRPIDVTMPEDQSILASARGERQSGKTTTYETCLRRTDGETVPVLIAGTPRWQNGKVIGAIAAITDLTEQKRAEGEIHQNAARAEALVRIAARFNAQLDLNAVLNAVCEQAVSVLNTGGSLVFLYDEKRDVFSVVAGAGVSPEHRAHMQPIPRAVFENFTQRNDGINIIPDAQQVPYLPNAEAIAAANLRTLISAPISRQQKKIGLLAVSTVGSPRQFSEEELALLKGIADQAAMAITNARLHDETRRRLAQVQAMNTIGMTIASSFDLRVIFKVFLDQVVNQLGVDAADILLFDPATQMLLFKSGVGFHGTALQHTHLRVGDGYAGQAARERRIHSVLDLVNNPDGLTRSPLLASERFASYVAVPLIAKGQLKGVLEIFHRSRLEPDSDWLDLLQTLASQAAIAIDDVTMLDKLQHANVELAVAYDATIDGWSRALDRHDKETEGHSRRVMEMTLRLARAAGMTEAELAHVRRGALLHDIGKMGIPDTILLKPDQLTNEEWDVMRQHPTNAFELLSPIAYLRPALDIPYCHHEKWDGSGYPRGLKAEEIPLAARLFAVVDEYDDLRSARAHRPGWSEDKVREHIRSLAGTQFDPKAVHLFFQELSERAQ